MEYVVWGISLALAVFVVHVLLVLEDRVLVRFEWRYILISPFMLIAGGLLGLIPTSIAGTPEWTRLATMGVVMGWIVLYCAMGAMRVGRARGRGDTS